MLYQTKQTIHALRSRLAYRRYAAQHADSLERLAAVKDIHRGGRCFIIGNGPSLKQTDLTRLRHEFTFGLNRIYLLFPELGFTTTYFVSFNRLVLEQFAAEIGNNVPVPKFTSWENHDLTHAIPDFSYLFRHNGAGFYGDVGRGVWGGGTVTYVAMQLAFHMGFQRVILIGVDHSFATQGKANKTITSDGGDPNHFDPRYFGKGIRWQLPDLETSELGYSLARQHYESAGRQILDATIGGKLQIFPKVAYDTLF